MRARLLVIASIASLSCQGATDDCADAACRQARVLATWETDRDGAIGAAAGISDPVERLAVVVALAQAHPETARPLCDALSDPAEREQCNRVIDRPHLRADQGDGGPTARERLARRSPMNLRLLVDAQPLASPWTGQPARDLGDCDADAVPCISALARQEAKAGQADRAGALCLAIPDGEWRQDCFFGAAETFVRPDEPAPPEPSRIAPAIRLCLGSGSFQGECMRHLSGHMASLAPPSDHPDPVAWRGVLDGVGAARAELIPRDPAVAASFADAVWSQALWTAVESSPRVFGNPADALPSEALPHLRAAVANRIARQGIGDDLDEAVRLATGAIAMRSNASAPPLPVNTMPPVKDTWHVVWDGEETFKQVHYLVDTARAAGASPEDDLFICMLEAAARLDPPRVDLLLQAATNPSVEVRWTAARLLAMSGGDTTPLQTDSDPRVRARALRVPTAARSTPQTAAPTGR